jgi:hypothetical protein
VVDPELELPYEEMDKGDNIDDWFMEKAILKANEIIVN